MSNAQIWYALIAGTVGWLWLLLCLVALKPTKAKRDTYKPSMRD